LVYGERSRQSLIELGEDPHRIAVSGAAYLAGRPRQTYQTDPRIADFLGLKPGQPWILLATSGPGHSVSLEHHRLVVRRVAELSAVMPDARFVAKLHPKDQVAFYTAAEQAAPGSRLLVVTGKEPRLPRDIFAWLQGCTAMLTGASAAALEALLMDVPVVTMDFMNELEGIDFIDAGATLHCRTAQDLQKAVQTVVCKPAGPDRLGEPARKFLRESFENLDGDPARAAAEIIRDLPGKEK
jgi:UDP-N-acetylglucosamine 2-epimerase